MMRLIIGFVVFLSCWQNADAALSPISEIYLGSREGDPASIVENVSTIHGNYTEVEVDLTVAAPDSLVLSRYYSSKDTLPIASLGGWRFNPQCFLKMQEDPTSKTYTSAEGTFQRTFVYVGNPDGTILTYIGWRNITNPTKIALFKIDVEAEGIGIANTAKGDISAWTNLKNNTLYYHPQNDSFELSLCTEGKRFYIKNPVGDFYSITHEILPSGNKIFYAFNTENQLEHIKETNASETKVLAWIKIQYGTSIHLEASDGKTTDYQFEEDASGILLLTTVTRSHKPNLCYQYQVADDRALLIKKTLPDGCFVQIDYDLDKSKTYNVKSVTTPGGSEGTSTTQFIYHADSTEVNRPGHQKAVYRFNDDLQLIAVDQYLNDSLYRTLQKSWGRRSDAGNLISTSVADGTGNVFYHNYFIYDTMNRGNIIEEREYGDVAGTGSIVLTIDEEGMVTNQDGHIKNYSYFSGKTTHGFFQRDAKGTGVKYWYKKGTNLLIKKFVLTKGSLDSEDEDHNSDIKQRFYYAYNDDTALIQVIVDDGKEGDSKNFYGVRERKITNINPKQEMPNVGAPEIIEQKYSDGKLDYLIQRTINGFDSQGNVSSQKVYDANSEYLYTINKKYLDGLLVLETDPMENEIHYTYDANQNLKTERHSETGLSIEYGYDLKNRLIHTIEKDRMENQFETQTTYDAAGYISKERDRFGNETIYNNDSLGRPVSITYPDSNNNFQNTIKTYTYTYDLFDNAVSVTDPKKRTLTKTYTVKGKPAEINYLDGTKESFRYDSGGNLHHHYCKNGILEVFEYDYIGRPSKIEYHRRDDNKLDRPFKEISYDYNTFHKTSETDARGKRTIYIYNSCGRLASIKKESQRIAFFYDSQGRTQSIKKWKSAKDFTLEIKAYDLLDRVIEERIENTSGHTLIKNKLVYNDTGALSQIISYPQNQKSILMHYEYDGFGRLSKAINAVGHATQIFYNDTYINDWGQRGRKRTVIDPMGTHTEEIFDCDNHLIQTCKKDASGKLLSYVEASHDCSGNKTLEKALIISADGPSRDFEVQYSYNQGDQLEAIVIGKGSLDERMTRLEYNAYGELTKKFYPGTQTPIAYQYDTRGYLEKVSFNEDKKTRDYKLYYDYNDNLNNMVCPHLSLSYAYDGNDLPMYEAVKDEFGSYKVSRTYDGEGNVAAITFPDGSYAEYSYEGPWVKSIARFSKDKRELYTYAVASRDYMGNITEEILPGHLGSQRQIWDEAGRRTAITTDYLQDTVLRYDPLDNINKRETSFEEDQFGTNYTYNALSQLISEQGEVDHSYSYDSIGNRLKKDGFCYKVNELNELIETETCAYTFLPNGNVSTKTVNGKTWTYQSNPLNQIVSIQDNDQSTVIFTYDLTGKRFSKRIDSKGKRRILRYFYIDDTEIGCVDEKGTLVELKIPSDPNDPESPAIAIEIKKETYIPLYDLQGNIACLLDHSRRKIVESYRYSVYGEEKILNARGRTITDSSVGNPWRYRGKRVDKEVDLIYFGYRYYDPEIGRWISPDPIGTLDGPNLYAFARNNPLRYVDYFGFNSEPAENCGCVLHGHPGWHHAPPDCVCICGRDGASGGVIGSYRSKRGSDIKSTLGGIGHGVVDFLIGSLYNFETTIAYIGSVNLFTLYSERIDFIKAVELSQMQRMTTVENFIMGALSIDESDTDYLSTRYKTTLGLNVASLVAGAYGAVKGVLSFSKLTRLPTTTARLVNSRRVIVNNVLTPGKLKSYLSNVESFNKTKIVSDLKSIGLKLKGKSPDGRFMNFADRHGNIRVKIHPADKVTNYNHLHIYDKSGNSLNRYLEIVQSTSTDAHIPYGGN